jgi:magnesium chelatase family protein
MILSTTLRGIEAHIVRISALSEPGAPALVIRGLATAAERECRVRVQSALANIDTPMTKRASVAVDGNGLALDGAGFDLGIALAIAGAGNEARVAAIGELSLSGEVRPVRGVLPSVEALRDHADVILVAPENLGEAALVGDARVFGVRNLKDALRVVGGDTAAAIATSSPTTRQPSAHVPDMADIKGLDEAKRALAIAAAGGHHILLVGGPGPTTFCSSWPTS